MRNGRSVCEDSRNGLIDLAHVGGVPAIYIWRNALFGYSVQQKTPLKLRSGRKRGHASRAGQTLTMIVNVSSYFKLCMFHLVCSCSIVIDKS